MKKRSLPFWQFLGFIFVSIGGTLLHFLYDWTDKSIYIASFSGVNESTWEHIKLLFFPLFIFAIIQSRFFKDRSDFWCVKLIGTIIGMLAIPTIFYTYNGAFGKSPDWLNITIFFVSAAIVFLLEARLFKRNSIKCTSPMLPFAIFILIAILFGIFTFYPPKIPLFQDPTNNTFGI